MNADRWKVVKGLFQRALKLPPYDWAAYLDRVSAGDEDLRRDVASLLAEHDPNAAPLLSPLASGDVTLELERLRLSEYPTDESTAPEEPTDG